MWFDNLMDDFKRSLLLINKYRGVFVPIFLRLAMNVIIGLVVLGGVITTVASGVFTGLNDGNFVKILFGILAPISITVVLTYIVYIVLWSLIEVGSISLYGAAIRDEKPSKVHFKQGVRSYLGKVFSGKLLIHFLVLVSTPIWFFIFLLYLVVVGIPTGGWGAIFLGAWVSAFFLSWTTAIVHDDLGAMEGLKAGFGLARKHMKPLFLISLASLFLVGYFSMILGPIAFVFAGWLFGGMVRTFFKVTIYLTYIRYNSDEQGTEDVSS